MRCSGSRRSVPLISWKLRTTVLRPSVITSGSGTWNRSPPVRTGGSLERARWRRTEYDSIGGAYQRRRADNGSSALLLGEIGQRPQHQRQVALGDHSVGPGPDGLVLRQEGDADPTTTEQPDVDRRVADRGGLARLDPELGLQRREDLFLSVDRDADDPLAGQPPVRSGHE